MLPRAKDAKLGEERRKNDLSAAGMCENGLEDGVEVEVQFDTVELHVYIFSFP